MNQSKLSPPLVLLEIGKFRLLWLTPKQKPVSANQSLRAPFNLFTSLSLSLYRKMFALLKILRDCYLTTNNKLRTKLNCKSRTKCLYFSSLSSLFEERAQFLLLLLLLLLRFCLSQLSFSVFLARKNFSHCKYIVNGTCLHYIVLSTGTVM